MKQPPLHGTRIDRAQHISGTWAGGTTQQIYAYPAEPAQTIAGAQFWLGTATIERNAAYSFFPQRTRIHIPIHGNGIRLHFQAPDQVVGLNTYEPYRFDGARPVRVELLDGPIIALNLIFHTNIPVEAAIIHFDQQQIILPGLTAPETHNDANHNQNILRIVYVITGAVRLRVSGDPGILLNPTDTYSIHSHTNAEHLPILLERQDVGAKVIVATVWMP